MSWIITKEIAFEAGHRLINYDGKCKNLHGHNYVAIVGLESDKLTPEGFVRDFGDVKATIKDWINNHLDHGMILHENDPIAKMCFTHSQKVFLLPENPTAEVMAKYFYWIWKTMIPELKFVEILETPTSRARYTR